MNWRRSSAAVAPSMQRLGVLWLCALAAVDIALRLWGQGGVSASASPLLLLEPVVIGLVFWGAFVILLRRFVHFIARRDRLTLSWVMQWALRIALWGFHLYLLLLWAHVVTHGSLPNPVAVEFLLKNVVRIPQHVLQTAPFLTASILLVALGAAWMTERSALAMQPAMSQSGGLPAAARREWLAGLLLLLVWVTFVFVIQGGAAAGDGLVPARVSDHQVALARRQIEQLPPRSAPRADIHISPTVGDPMGTSGANSAAKGFPVIVVLIESLRHDLLVQQPEAIPFLKSLHEDYVGFDFAYATASHSNLTDLAFWYGQYPLRGPGKESFPSDAPWKGTSLFGAFKSSGYATAYISSQNEKWGNMVNWLDVPEVDYFFDSERYGGATWENPDDAAGLVNLIKKGLATAGKVEDSQTLAVARRWIEAQGRQPRFFLGMNLQNTHFSYVIPPQGAEPYAPADLGMQAIYYRWPQDRKVQVRNRYLNAVTNVDRLLKEFADFLRARGLWDECLFVVLGDNGEAFYEHGFGNHSGPMYDETVRTLVAIKPPASLKLPRQRVATPVSHIDVAATLPLLAGVLVPESFQGEPVLPQPSPRRPVYMYSNAFVRQYGMVEGNFKLLLTEYPEQRSELYDLKNDPGETRNVITHLPLVAASMTHRLLDWRLIQMEYYAGEWYRTRRPPRQFEQ